MADFTGQIVLVTGAGTGIGAAIARAFLANGATLAATYHGSADGARRLEEAAGAVGRPALIRPVDAREVGQIDAFVVEAIQTLGHVDILVYNSGLTDPRPLFELTEEQWDSTLDINLKGMFFCARAVAAHMRERSHPGSIVLLSSVHSIQAYRAHAHYAASKGGINMLTRSLALQLAPDGIRVNAIAPGSIYVERDYGTLDLEEMGKHIPLGRVGKPEEMAEVALFLASPAASYVTGHVLFADGGLTLPLNLP
jgi:glucose 1-dehydrogenase